MISSCCNVVMYMNEFYDRDIQFECPKCKYKYIISKTEVIKILNNALLFACQDIQSYKENYEIFEDLFIDIDNANFKYYINKSMKLEELKYENRNK